MSVRLEQLLAAKPATGPRLFTLDEERDMARLLIDMGEALEYYVNVYYRHDDMLIARYNALLARLDALGKDTT